MANRKKLAAMFADSDEDEREAFEVTNDDIINEFNPNRPQFRQTKEQALYGIWATKTETNYGRKKKDFTAPVTFISGGIKEGAKRERLDPEEEENMDNYEEEMAQQSKPKVTLTTVQKPAQRPTKPSTSDEGHSYSLTAKAKQKEKVSNQFGSFERHTKGIGMKLMKKMGFKVGKGLGRDNQGIINPIEAVKRTRKAGLGAAGTERTKQSYIHFPTQDSEEEEEKEFKEQITRWKKDGVDRSKKKYVYKTVEELKKSGKTVKRRKESQPETPIPSALANVKVIDMTGREQKVFSGYHAIAGRHAVDPDSSDSSEEESANVHPTGSSSFSCVELQHNLDMLIESTEQKILHNERQLEYEEDRAVTLKHQQDQLQETLKQEEKEIQKLERLLQTISQCEERAKTDTSCDILLDELAEVFADLQEKYFPEYKMFELSDLAIGFVLPQIKKYFANWMPLDKPSFGLTEMKRWKMLLELDQSSYSMQESAGLKQLQNGDMYQYIVWDVWMPRIRNAMSQWDPRDCLPLIELVEHWMPLLPSWILENVLMQLVFPRLQQEVDAWNPLTDPVPLHAWIHPWLPHLQSKLEPLYAPIRQKLGNALQMWHPRDPSAKVILEPWHEVFSRGSWDAFVVKNILPKLENCLREFIINPQDQSLADFQCVMEWEELVPRPSIVSLLETNFFPKWLRALSSWLNSASVDYAEVAGWYSGWKTAMPEGLLNNSFVKDRFKQAVDMMNRAITGQLAGDVDAEDFEPVLPGPSRPTLHPLSQAAVQSAPMPGNFRDLLQKRAEERGLIFVPLKSTMDGKTVYRLGSKAVYVDRSVVYMKEGGTFLPLPLSSALEKASVG